MYKEIKGDLLDLFDKGEFEIIGHGANCFSTMGAGIAVQIKKRYPEAYYADLYDCRGCMEKLGDYSATKDGDIFNIYSQYRPGPNLDYEALALALRKINYFYSKMHIGLPQIGAGIAGGDWKKIKKIIKKELKDMDVTVVMYDKK